jgi:hypothetical protein
MNRMTESADEHTCQLRELRRAICWLQTPVIAPERAQYRRSMVPRKHVPPPHWRFAGQLGDARIDPTSWVMRGRPTLKAEPIVRELARMTNRDVYGALLSRLFDEPADGCAFPHAFEAPRAGPPPRHAGYWHHLLPDVHGLATDHPRMRSAVREVFTLSRTQAMPLRARQALWQLHAGGLPVVRAAMASAQSLTPCELRAAALPECEKRTSRLP